MAQPDSLQLRENLQATLMSTTTTNEVDDEKEESDAGLSNSTSQTSRRKRALVLAGCSILQLPI